MNQDHDAKITIFRMLDLSTGHLTKTTANVLSETPIEEWPVTGARSPYGFLIAVPDALSDALPHDLRACLVAARNLDCQYILFDRDARIIETLAQYEW